MKIIILLVLIVASLNASAQGMIIDAQVMMISDNTDIVIGTPFINNGNLINQGRLYIENDWTNNQVFADTSGQVILYGMIPQTLNLNTPDEFFDLEINGSGEKSIVGNCIVNNVLSLQEGLVTSLNGNYLLLRESGSIIGGSQASYISGLLYCEGLSDKLYPLGKNGNYAPVQLSNIEGNYPVIGFEVFEPIPNPLPGQGLSSVSNIRYWRRSVLSGSMDQATATLTVVGDEDFSDLQFISVAETQDLNQPFANLGQSYNSGDVYNGTITGLRSFKSDYLAIGLISDRGFVDQIFIPNAFSPLAPAANDRAVRIYSTMISDFDFSFKVYSRKGALVFDANSYQEMQQVGWTGINGKSGKAEPIGVYDYILTGKLVNGRFFKKSGTIALIN